MKSICAGRGTFGFWALFCWGLLVAGCSIPVTIPTVVDDGVERLVRTEAARIVAVSEDRENFSAYRFFLSEFPRKDILGMSVGSRRIYINYELATLALRSSGYRWLLRQTLAHEIAHETAGHARQQGASSLNRGPFGGASGRDVGLPWNVRLYNYSTDKELEADAKGLGYWNRLGWDCHVWIRILEGFEKQNYAGDVFHPTDKRLQQATRLCASRQDEKQPSPESPMVRAEPQRRSVSSR